MFLIEYLMKAKTNRLKVAMKRKYGDKPDMWCSPQESSGYDLETFDAKNFSF